MEKLYRQARWLALLGSVLFVGQLWLSWPRPRTPGAIYLQSCPEGARVDFPSAGSLHGFHRKTIGHTPGPLPIDPKERANFTLVLSLWGYHEEVVHLSSEELIRGERSVELRPRWPILPSLCYAVRDYAPLLLFLLLAIAFGVFKVRPLRLRERRLRELLEQKELQPGAELLGYRVEAELGRGGMSRVYRVRRVHGGEQLAMKVLRSDWAADPIARRRFQGEVDIWRKLSHPHIVHLLDWGESAGFVWLITELVVGTPSEELAHPSFEQLEVWAEQLASALDYAHGQGVVHRDLKPANVIIDSRKRARLLDFGVAGRLSEVGESSGNS